MPLSAPLVENGRKVQEIAREMEDNFGFRAAVRHSGSQRLVRITVSPRDLMDDLVDAVQQTIADRVL